MGVDAVWRAVVLGQTEVTQFQHTRAGDEQVVRLQIPVKDPVHVQVLQTTERHQRVGLDVRLLQHQRHVLDDDLQVRVHEVEDKRHVRLVAEGVQQADDVLVLQLLEQLDLPQGGAVDAVLGLGAAAHLDLFDGDDLARLTVQRLVDGGELTLAEKVYFLIAAQPVLRHVGL